MAKSKLPQTLQDWVEARKRHHLSHAHVQMARELGMNPKKLGKIDNHRQEPWKAPLPQFIESLYEKSFGRSRPQTVLSIEERAQPKAAKKAGVTVPKPHVIEGGDGLDGLGQPPGRPLVPGQVPDLGSNDVRGEHDGR
jgi:hypothetical protein